MGHDDKNADQDRDRLRVTYHHNWFDGSKQRNPRVRFGEPVHIFNNYYRNNTGYGVASQIDAGVVCLFPGDWFGFRVGSTHAENIHWTQESRGKLACLCVPSVRNGHITTEMLDFLKDASSCLLNLNLYPTLAPEERSTLAHALTPVLDKSLLSISFSRGFGLTASQLGVILVHRDHPLRARYASQWYWYTYFHNGLAARAFMALDFKRLEAVDAQRRHWVQDWLLRNELPAVHTGSYYVKSFRPEGQVAGSLQPLFREGVVRLCFKPPISGEGDS